MDPTETLYRLRELARNALTPSLHDDSSEAVELATMFQNLDQWLARGGFYPEQWEHPRKGGR
jgi:hypothetical protein